MQQKTLEKSTALLRQQEQQLRDAVSLAIEIAQKAGATSGKLKMLNLTMTAR